MPRKPTFEEKNFEVQETALDKLIEAAGPSEENPEVYNALRPKHIFDGGAVSKSDLKWSEYILSQLDESEKFKGSPKVNGLRRMVLKNIGPVLSEALEVHQTPSKENKGSCVVKFAVTVLEEDRAVQYVGLADAFEGNTEPFLHNFTTCFAETRARGRAYKHALAINCHSAEELNGTADPFDSTKISDSQLAAIDNICKKNDINAGKFFSKHAKEFKYQKVRDVLKADASTLIERLHDYTNVDAPPDLIGYVASWNSK